MLPKIVVVKNVYSIKLGFFIFSEILITKLLHRNPYQPTTNSQPSTMCYTISQQETSKKSKEKQELPCYTSSCSTSSFHPKFFPHNKIFPTPTAIQQGFF